MYVYIIYMIHHDSICLALERPAVQLHLIKHSIAPWSLQHRHSSTHVEGAHDGLVKADKFKEAKSCLVSKGAKTCSTKFRKLRPPTALQLRGDPTGACKSRQSETLDVQKGANIAPSFWQKSFAHLCEQNGWCQGLLSCTVSRTGALIYRDKLDSCPSDIQDTLRGWHIVASQSSKDFCALTINLPVLSILPVNIAGAQRIPPCQWKQPQQSESRIQAV